MCNRPLSQILVRTPTLSVSVPDVPLNVGDDSMTESLFTGASLTPRSNRSSNFVMQHQEATIMDQLGQPGKYLTAGSIGAPFSETPINSSPLAKNAIDFVGPFPVSNGYSYILLVVDYISRWVEAVATKTNDAKVVVDFLKSIIFYRFGVSKALISDQGRGGASSCHSIPPQTNNQAEVFNREIKKTLQKMANPNR
ncbi:Gag-Pol polyprotein, partial [Mucuna pruriens]